MLESRDRSGIYLADCNNVPEEQIVDIIACSEIAYMSESQETSYTRELFYMLLHQSAQYGYATRMWRISYYAALSEYQELIEKHKIRNAMLVLPHCNEITRLFAAEKVHYTEVLPRYYPEKGPAVIDAPDMVPRQMKYLYDHGHRKIAFIQTVDIGFYSLTDLLRREDYYRFMSENGLKVLPEWVVHYSIDEKILFPRLDRMMNSPQAPTALVIFEWFQRQVYNYCQSRGIKIGQDLSIISSDGIETANYSPQATMVVSPISKTVDLAWQLFLESRDGSKGTVIDYIDLEIREGDSVATL